MCTPQLLEEVVAASGVDLEALDLVMKAAHGV